jgi:hypothetical protein
MRQQRTVVEWTPPPSKSAMRGVIYPDDEPWVVTDIGYVIGVICPLKQEVLIWLHIPFRVCNVESL